MEGCQKPDEFGRDTKFFQDAPKEVSWNAIKCFYEVEKEDPRFHVVLLAFLHGKLDSENGVCTGSFGAEATLGFIVYLLCYRGQPGMQPGMHFL